jgi:hypothetical protein
MSRRLVLRVAVAALGLMMLAVQLPVGSALATPSIPIPPPVDGGGHMIR